MLHAKTSRNSQNDMSYSLLLAAFAQFRHDQSSHNGGRSCAEPCYRIMPFRHGRTGSDDNS